MRITKAVFAGSSEKLSDRPKARLHEFAFIGRSNVGKSSLINTLCGVSKLAKTSATPGKTLLINHFLINDAWYLVDLPGYGYAKISQKGREKLLDSRLPIQKIDLEFLMALGEAQVPFAIIFTKGDKLGKVALANQIEKNKKSLLEYWDELPPVFVTSSENGMGKEDVIAYIEETPEIVKKEQHFQKNI